MQLRALLTLVPSYLLWASLIPAALAAPTAPTDDKSQYTILDQETDDFVNKVLSDWKSPGGVAIAFVRRDETGKWVNIETKGYGVASANGTKMTDESTFNIGSNSKLFNIVANGILIHNETLTPQIDWTTKIKEIIPQFNLTDPVATSEANILDLATHRTGYPLHDFSYRYSDTVEEVIHKIQYLRQSAEFRDLWQYNNNMYTTLSYIIPKLTGTPFARYVKENVFDKLNMTHSTYSYQLANSNGQRCDGMVREGIDAYSTDAFAGKPRAAQYWTATTGGEDGSVLAGAGGVITSAIDMAQWLRTLLNDGRHPDTNETVIPEGVLSKIATAISVQEGNPEWPEYSSIIYGAAQLQITYRGHLIIEHGGFIRGFNTQISRLPNDNFGVSVLTNDGEFGKTIGEIIKNHVIDKVLDLDPIDWNTRWIEKRSIPPPRATPRPENATLPSADFTDFAGVWNNDGYYPLELCLVQPVNPNPSDYCKELQANLTTVLPGGIRPDIPTLYGAIDSAWFSHIRVEHFNADLWNVSLLISTPTNDPSEPYWTYNDKSKSDNLMIAETEVVDGKFGMGMAGFWAGLWDGASAGVPKPIGDTVRERAEVYWDKLSNSTDASGNSDSQDNGDANTDSGDDN